MGRVKQGLIELPVHRQTIPVYYVDSSVLLNLFLGSSRPGEADAAKRFMARIAQGAAKGIVSTWVLMEVITVLRRARAKKGVTKTEEIETGVESVLGSIYRIRNLKFVSGKPDEISHTGGQALELWRILEDGLEHLRDSLYTVEWNEEQKSYLINGIAGNDALHIMLAKAFGCDSLATFDKGFWADDRPVTIYDVKNDEEK